MNRLQNSESLKRFLACLAGGFVLAIMVGPQEGTQDDFGYEFRQSVFHPRIVIFLLLGVLAYFAITFWPRIVPVLTTPGMWPLISGALAVLASVLLMNWYDPFGNFNKTRSQVVASAGPSALTNAFFQWLAWAVLAACVVIGGVAIARRLRPLAYGVAVLAVVAAVLSFLSHRDVVSLGTSSKLGVDHSLGFGAAIIGFLVMAGALVSSAMSESDVADSKRFFNTVFGWRPGLPVVVLGLIVGLIAFASSTWFSPATDNDTLGQTHDLFEGQGLSAVSSQYLAWLGWVLLAVTTLVAAAACWLGQRVLGWVATALGLVAVLLTLITLYDISNLGGQQHYQGASGPWQNLGTGGWLAGGAFFLLGAGGFVVATLPQGAVRGAVASAPVATDTATPGVAASSVGDPVGGPTGGAHSSTAVGATAARSSDRSAASGYLSAPGAAKTAILALVAFALFYPPTATLGWQTTIVSQIGISVLLAMGLNVVVGWAGLLDLGFIAFYAIGSYTTAYLTSSLPVEPPSWLHMTPLLAIPFAIAICLLAGLALGAPTLRLRGDYLAIVTLGFGEIIRIIAVNNPGNFTNGSQGAHGIPNPVIHIGPLHWTWGLAPLQYWYLLLVFIVVILLAFRRLENSRTGRAWAAIREDEVAAQATGINTTRVKLMAFAIGASTSGVAGVFFASQIGSFTPDNFVLNNSILIVAYVVFGGMGSLPGAMAGAALLTWLPEFLKTFVPGADRQMWIGVVVVLMMIFRPAGLVPASRRKAELTHFDEPSSSETQAVPLGEGLGAHA